MRRVTDYRRCVSAKALRQLKQIALGDGLPEQAAARCIHDLAFEIEALNERLAELEAELQRLLSDTPAPFDDLPGVGLATTVTLIAQSGDVRRFRNDAAYARYGGAAPIPCGSGATAGRHRLHRGQRLPAPHRRHASPRRPECPRLPRAQGLPRGKRNEKHGARSTGISPTSTDACTPGPNARSRHYGLDIGASNGRSPAATWAPSRSRRRSPTQSSSSRR